ncbi:hypothetical protein [Streptomyces sp. NPDC046976]|uniref:hypothetical protein n=1 Tax=Streptomyces sp. NPDC046976 TaxID=3155258 RepID=UPI0033F045DB
MDAAQAKAPTMPLTAAEQDQVQRAATIAGKTVEDFMHDAVLAAAHDPFLAALEQAAVTIADRADLLQHGYAATGEGRDHVNPGPIRARGE